MKIAKIFPIFKKGINRFFQTIDKYHFFHVFKIFERIMYSRLNAYLPDDNLLFNKQVGFRSGHSTEHAPLELIDQISDSFNGKSYFPGILIDLSKGFDTVDHKLQHYGIKGKNLS